MYTIHDDIRICICMYKYMYVCKCIGNQDPIGIIMGPAFATTSSGVSNAVLEAHKALSREQARGKDGGNLDSRFRLLLLLNALDTKLLHNSVQKLGK